MGILFQGRAARARGVFRTLIKTLVVDALRPESGVVYSRGPSRCTSTRNEREATIGAIVRRARRGAGGGPGGAAADLRGARERDGRDARGERRGGDRGGLPHDHLAGGPAGLERRP